MATPCAGGGCISMCEASKGPASGRVPWAKMVAAPRDRVRSRRERRSLMARSRVAVSIYRLLSDGRALCELLFYWDSALLGEIARSELDAGISRMRISWAFSLRDLRSFTDANQSLRIVLRGGSLGTIMDRETHSHAQCLDSKGKRTPPAVEGRCRATVGQAG